MKYQVWIEHEEYVSNEFEEEYCNVAVKFQSGTTRGFNVWTTQCFKNHVSAILSAVDEQGYAMLPDLIVRDLARPTIEHALRQVVVLE